MGLFDKIFGTYSDRELKDIKPIVNKILELEAPYKALSDEELKGKTAQFKERYKGGESLDALLPEAFATVREASDRVLGMRPYPVQLHRRHRAPSGAHRRNEDRRRQNPGGHPARLP